jgi:hypothetical protein
MNGDSRKAIGHDRVDIRNITDANSSRDAFTPSGTPATIATPPMARPFSREASHSEEDSNSRHGKILGMPATSGTPATPSMVSILYGRGTSYVT